MDTFSHYLWTVALYWQHPKRWWVGLWGAIPDVLSFGLVLALEVGHLSGNGPPSIESLPWWIVPAYGLTHSLLICSITLGLLYLWKPHVPLLMIGWPLHIFIDLPTHTSAYFPTPLLWPLSNWTFSGFSWGTGWFMLANLLALIGVYTWLVISTKRGVPHAG